MGLQLADPITDRLARSPLSLVVCQVKHERNPHVADPKRALALHEVVKVSYPTFDENATQDVNMIVGSGGLQALPSETNRGWRLRSADEAWTVVVMSDFFALETTAYIDWDDFRDRLQTLTQTVEKEFGPSIERRIGLRYVDRIVDSSVTRPTDWRGKIDPALLGPIAHDELGPGVTTTQGLVQLKIDQATNVVLRHGCFADAESDGDSVYLLDHDCARETTRPFVADDVMASVDSLHTTALQVFQASLTTDYFESLRKD